MHGERLGLWPKAIREARTKAFWRPECSAPLCRWTNGRFKSTLHRVVNANERFSTPFFLAPNWDAKVPCHYRNTLLLSCFRACVPCLQPTNIDFPFRFWSAMHCLLQDDAVVVLVFASILYASPMCSAIVVSWVANVSPVTQMDTLPGCVAAATTSTEGSGPATTPATTCGAWLTMRRTAEYDKKLRRVEAEGEAPDQALLQRQHQQQQEQQQALPQIRAQ